MTERERLIELIELIQNAVNGCARHWAEIIADHLLRSGVIVPPCKVGDAVYSINKSAIKGHWEEHRYIVDDWGKWKVCEIPFSLTLWECGWKDIFLSREEAEKALERREGK